MMAMNESECNGTSLLRDSDNMEHSLERAAAKEQLHEGASTARRENLTSMSHQHYLPNDNKRHAYEP